jgi:hypothetical protein
MCVYDAVNGNHEPEDIQHCTTITTENGLYVYMEGSAEVVMYTKGITGNIFVSPSGTDDINSWALSFPYLLWVEGTLNPYYPTSGSSSSLPVLPDGCTISMPTLGCWTGPVSSFYAFGYGDIISLAHGYPYLPTLKVASAALPATGLGRISVDGPTTLSVDLQEVYFSTVTTLLFSDVNFYTGQLQLPALEEITASLTLQNIKSRSRHHHHPPSIPFN